MQAQKRKKQPRTRPVIDNETIKALITTYLKQRIALNTMKGRAILETGVSLYGTYPHCP